MMTPSYRDVEQLSAYLDGQLSQAEKTRLVSRFRSEPVLVTALDELRKTRILLRRMPQHRVPRNFTLTPRMAGIKPPVPRVAPVLSWASAVAMLVFLFSLGANLIGQSSFGAASPMMAAAPSDMGGGEVENTQTSSDANRNPEATLPPVSMGIVETPTPENSILTAPETTAPGNHFLNGPSSVQKSASKPAIKWPFIWLGLAVVLISGAFLVRWLNQLAFKNKLSKK